MAHHCELHLCAIDGYLLVRVLFSLASCSSISKPRPRLMLFEARLALYSLSLCVLVRRSLEECTPKLVEFEMKQSIQIDKSNKEFKYHTANLLF